MFPGRSVKGLRAQHLVKQGALLFDVRDPVSFRNGSIPGATNLHLRQVSSLQKYPRDTKMIFFGSGPADDTLKAIVSYAFQYGFTNVFILDRKEDWDK